MLMKFLKSLFGKIPHRNSFLLLSETSTKPKQRIMLSEKAIVFESLVDSVIIYFDITQSGWIDPRNDIFQT